MGRGADGPDPHAAVEEPRAGDQRGGLCGAAARVVPGGVPVDEGRHGGAVVADAGGARGHLPAVPGHDDDDERDGERHDEPRVRDARDRAAVQHLERPRGRHRGAAAHRGPAASQRPRVRDSASRAGARGREGADDHTRELRALQGGGPDPVCGGPSGERRVPARERGGG
mmetsp:Transcript_10667/g.14295  ORF Transcript_10667/g.14295 Transcript_10667/m.14295 type:complete len:170 (+) Transcript_10667:429-938(+)|eukprot:9904796-Ditylum_brightwellii.AAC.1